MFIFNISITKLKKNIQNLDQCLNYVKTIVTISKKENNIPKQNVQMYFYDKSSTDP